MNIDELGWRPTRRPVSAPLVTRREPLSMIAASQADGSRSVLTRLAVAGALVDGANE